MKIDPEGLVGCFTSIACVLIGLQVGFRFRNTSKYFVR